MASKSVGKPAAVQTFREHGSSVVTQKVNRFLQTINDSKASGAIIWHGLQMTTSVTDPSTNPGAPSNSPGRRLGSLPT